MKAKFEIGDLVRSIYTKEPGVIIETRRNEAFLVRFHRSPIPDWLGPAHIKPIKTY